MSFYSWLLLSTLTWFVVACVAGVFVGHFIAVGLQSSPSDEQRFSS
jgi:hypothetical protein